MRLTGPPAALIHGGGCGSCRPSWRRTNAATGRGRRPHSGDIFFSWVSGPGVEHPTASGSSLRGSSRAKRRVNFYPRSNARARSVPAQRPACPPHVYARHRVCTALSSRHLQSDSGRYPANVGCMRAAWSLRGHASARSSRGFAGAGCRARIGACFGSRGWRFRLSRALGRSPML